MSEIEELLRRDREFKRTKINSETAKIAWSELQRFFAAGKVMQVDRGLDLVEVACALEQDDLESVHRWTDALELAPVSDAQARDWVTADAWLWAVVIKPWVLVQEID